MNISVPFIRAGLALAVAPVLALAAPSARAASILRDIYSTAPGNSGFHFAIATELEGGSQYVSKSDHTFHTAPHALRLKLLPGVARNVVGIRFITEAFKPNPMDLAADRGTTALEFWVNPKADLSASKLTVALVSAGAAKVETRLPLSRYLKPADYTDRWTFVSIPLKDFADTGIVHDAKTGQDTPAAFDWTQVVGLSFSCDTTGGNFYDPSVDDIRLYSTLD